MPIFCRSRRVRRGRLGAHEKKNTKSLRPNIPPTISSVDHPAPSSESSSSTARLSRAKENFSCSEVAAMGFC